MIAAKNVGLFTVIIAGADAGDADLAGNISKEFVAVSAFKVVPGSPKLHAIINTRKISG